MPKKKKKKKKKYKSEKKKSWQILISPQISKLKNIKLF